MNNIEKVLKEQKNKLNKEEIKENKIFQFVCFFVGNEEFGIPILMVQEIIKPIEWTRIPKTPNYVLGIFNLRGNVIPLIDLRKKFNLPEQKLNENNRIIVINLKSEKIGFLIDELTGASSVTSSEIEIPESINDENSIVDGVAKLKDKIVTILKIEQLMKKSF